MLPRLLAGTPLPCGLFLLCLLPVPVIAADGPMMFTTAPWNNKVYKFTDNSNLNIVDAMNGTLLRKFHGSHANHKLLRNDRLHSAWQARGGPVIADGTVYFAASIWTFMGIF